MVRNLYGYDYLTVVFRRRSCQHYYRKLAVLWGYDNRDFVRPIARENDMEHLRFQLDGPPFHKVSVTVDFFEAAVLRWTLIEKNGDFDWPPRSLDFTPRTFTSGAT